MKNRNHLETYRAKLSNMPPLAHGVKDWNGSAVCDYIRQEFGCDGEKAFSIFHDCRGRKNPILTFNRVTGLWEGIESSKKSKSRLYAINQGMLEMVTLLRSIDRKLSKLFPEGLPETKATEEPGPRQTTPPHPPLKNLDWWREPEADAINPVE
jgi:hypothetical protein